MFRIINHYPKLIVCDDNFSLKTAARFSFPSVKIQTCYNHFKEGVRRSLKVRTENTYKGFSKSIDFLLSEKRSLEDFNRILWGIYKSYQFDPVTTQILTDIERRKSEFLAYTGLKGAPITTNLIEAFNSHLEQRLADIKGFDSFQHAKLWLNGYVLRRRFTKLKECGGKFRPLNGRYPLQMTQKLDVDLTTLF
jgi:transposase-like protein